MAQISPMSTLSALRPADAYYNTPGSLVAAYRTLGERRASEAVQRDMANAQLTQRTEELDKQLEQQASQFAEKISLQRDQFEADYALRERQLELDRSLGMGKLGIESKRLNLQQQAEENLARYREAGLALQQNELASLDDYRRMQIGLKEGELSLAQDELNFRRQKHEDEQFMTADQKSRYAEATIQRLLNEFQPAQTGNVLPSNYDQSADESSPEPDPDSYARWWRETTGKWEEL